MDNKEYNKLLKDMGLSSGDIAQIKKMLVKFETNSGTPATEQDVKKAAKTYLKRKGNPHEDNVGQLINKYPGMGNKYKQGGLVKTYAKGGGVRKAQMGDYE